jgi:hypothetical protein
MERILLSKLISTYCFPEILNSISGDIIPDKGSIEFAQLTHISAYKCCSPVICMWFNEIMHGMQLKICSASAITFSNSGCKFGIGYNKI